MESTLGKRGKVIHSQAREIISNVIEFMKNDAAYFNANNCTRIPISNFKQRVIAATGISEKMYRTIIKEAKDVKTGVSSSFVSPRRKQSYKKTPQLIEGEKHAVTIIVPTIITGIMADISKEVTENVFVHTQESATKIKNEIKVEENEIEYDRSFDTLSYGSNEMPQNFHCQFIKEERLDDEQSNHLVVSAIDEIKVEKNETEYDHSFDTLSYECNEMPQNFHRQIKKEERLDDEQLNHLVVSAIDNDVINS